MIAQKYIRQQSTWVRNKNFHDVQTKQEDKNNKTTSEKNNKNVYILMLHTDNYGL